MKTVSGRYIGALILIAGSISAFAGDSTLLFHAEQGAGHRIVTTNHADQSFNPASVLKVATSLAALKKLGPDYRWATDFACSGVCTISDGRLQGDLVILGGMDPDFQAENAWLVAHELSELGIDTVTGDLVIKGVFFQGWEHGMEKRQTDALRRARLMGNRFRKALDVTRWDRSLHATWEDAAPRHGWSLDNPPRITLGGKPRLASSDDRKLQTLVRHQSNPLRITLKRFNTYSNNDIVRIGDQIGGPAAIQSLLEDLTTGIPGDIRVEAASGEKVNRLTARQIVRLLWAFDRTCRDLNLDPGDILPVPGCDPGSLPRMFPRLAKGNHARSAVIKSGTLTNTDGGVAVLSGFFDSLEGETVAFCVAAPRAGRRLRHFRLVEQDWLLDLMGTLGGARDRVCGPPPPFSDTMADARITLQPGEKYMDGESNAAN
jgi:D-alanyl-D-alanine carboxypeptidase/D-alanyl-D-alanine-endopeptidase (penicillin-binding protein 4)